MATSSSTASSFAFCASLAACLCSFLPLLSLSLRPFSSAWRRPRVRPVPLPSVLLLLRVSALFFLCSRFLCVLSLLHGDVLEYGQFLCLLCFSCCVSLLFLVDFICVLLSDGTHFRNVQVLVFI